MQFDVITLFPEFFRAFESLGVTGRAARNGPVTIRTWNPRDYAENRSGRVDDRPYGGGPGMVMQVGPLARALEAACGDDKVRVSLLSPQGQQLNQAAVRSLAGRDRMVLVCGRYEGIDQRFIDRHVDEEWSLGDYVLSGGELAATVLMDSVIRLLPGVLGDEDSAEQDSFTGGLLDHPHYTRPESLEGSAGEVPSVLLSGHHGQVEQWRRMQALGRTWQKRPDLLKNMNLNRLDRSLLDQFRQETEGRLKECPEEK